MYDQIKIHVPSEKVKSIPEKMTLLYKPWKRAFRKEYFPSVPSKFDRMRDLYLEIQFSASKIRCQNNLLETPPGLLTGPVVENLAKQLDKMEINIELNTLINESRVYNIEICKGLNIDRMPSWVLIDYFKKFPAPRGYMKEAEDFYRAQPQPGQCRYFGKHQEVTFYDKTKELLDNKQHNIEAFYLRRPNILRWEVRLHKQALECFFTRDMKGKKEKFITLSDLANKTDLYEKVINKYWKPFVKASKHIPIYASPEVQLAQIKSNLLPEEHKNLLLFKFFEDRQGYLYAKEYFEQNFKEELVNVIALYRKYSIMEIVSPQYQIIDKIDQAISKPHWWLTMEDVFKPNEHPFKFTDCLVEDFWTTKKSANYLGVCERVVQRKCKEGEIPSRIINRQYRLRKGDVMNYLYQHKLAAKGPETP